MSITSQKLDIKIKNFQSKYLSKYEAIPFEENKFDEILGILFNLIKVVFLKCYILLKALLMKTIDKILNFLTHHNELKKKILKQDEFLLNNTKLSSLLSEQIKQLNKKIDDISTEKKITSNSDDKKDIENSFINKNNNDSYADIEFYQKENLRISNELFETQKKFEIIKNEIEKFQDQRSNLIDKINSVNDVIKDSNVVTNVFDNNNLNQKINIVDTNKISKKDIDIDLNQQVANIFARN